MQSVSSRIWTRVAMSISCDDNHYTVGTSFYAYCTWYSQAVTHPSTDQARGCLTSVIGREPVFSAGYGRKPFKYRISLVWCHLSKLLHYLKRVPNFSASFSFTQSKLWQDMNLFCLHLVFLCSDDRCYPDRCHILAPGARASTLQSDLHFSSKILPNLKANWKTCSLTKLDKEINNWWP